MDRLEKGFTRALKAGKKNGETYRRKAVVINIARKARAKMIEELAIQEG